MKFFRTDIKRIFTEPSFWLSVFLGAVLLFGGLGYCLASRDGSHLYSQAQAIALPFAAPLLAAMPYSVMIMTERETKFGALMILKQSGTERRYRFKRFFTAGLSGAAALFIPHLALCAVCLVLGETPDASEFAQLILPITFGFGWAAFSYGLTFVNRQRYVPLVMPQVLYLLCIYAFPYLKLERFYPPLDIAPSVSGAVMTADCFVLPAVLAVSGLALTAFGKEADEQ
ncbi:MAG: hypothetical protein K2J73_10720 [Oscillospiraceae bacterium]|nr:hypothetical protein [Oscillospiraceae bacterium]